MTTANSKIVRGDVLFFARRRGDRSSAFVSAVANVASDNNGVYHTAIVVDNGASVHIVDATDRHNVVRESFDARIEEELREIPTESELLVGIYSPSVSPEERHYAIQKALAAVGLKYNDIFVPQYGFLFFSSLKQHENFRPGRAFYCCELIRHCYPTLWPVPTRLLRFSDGEHEISDYWRQYYKQRNMKVPIGEKGSHPSDLIKHPQLNVRFWIKFAGKGKLIVQKL